MLVKNQVKQFVKERTQGEMRVAGDFMDALMRDVGVKLQCAIQRARKNGRKTLKPHDL